MKKVLFVLSFFLFSLVSYAQKTYIKANGTGSGTSWSDASGDLVGALEQAIKGDQIWVAAGTYYPSTSGDRSKSFVIPDGVQLIGGFAGNESHVEDRVLSKNYTILSGEIGDPSLAEDNSFTIVYFERVSAKTVIDGFIIQDAFSGGTGAKGDIRRGGGGIFNNGSNGVSIPTIQNCIFSGNFAHDGAAIYNYAKNGDASSSILNCEFMFNKVDLEGGAIFNDGTNGICNALIRGCTFKGNEASYGGAIHNVATEGGEVTPFIEGCTFSGNVAYIKGSSVFNYPTSNGVCNPVINSCVFEDNTQSLGQDVEDVPTYSAEKNKSKSDLKMGSGK